MASHHQESIIREEIKPRSSSMVTSTGYWFSSDTNNQNPTPHNNIVNHQLQNFETNPDMYNLSSSTTSSMDQMMLGFPPNNNNPHHVLWKGNFLNKINGVDDDDDDDHGPSSSKNISEQFYQHETMLATTTSHQDSWHHDNNRTLLVDDPSMRCVFPCEGNERPSQGLSLSLCSSNPSSIGLQSFELRHQDLQQGLIHDGFLGKSTSIQQGYFHHHHQVRDSKYLGPAQELLSEFCSLGIKKNNDHSSSKLLLKQHDSTSKKQLLQSLDLLELQKRKTKLLQMLEEVDRRYKHYCDQMKGVVSSFEAVAGNGAATVYSALASRAMSRHFRCLRDGIVAQIKATKMAMGEKDSTTTLIPGSTRGETPRLRLLDQTLRQQKAFQQMNMMETHPWRPQRGLPERSVSVLRAWLFEHFLHPYPSDVDKHILARQTGLSRSQVSNWFINARVRLWKPMVEEMYLEETKEEEEENVGSQDGSKALIDEMTINNHQSSHTDQKPNLVRIESECISSIINHHPHDKNDQNYGVIRGGDQSFGAIELDFSTNIAYATNGSDHHHGGGGGSGGVSLTLGLQQHGGSSMGLTTFSSQPSHHNHNHQSSIFYPRDDHDQVQYSSLLDSENQNLPYRNLMGAQLLHDLAG
ncbi:homeobox protein BEL1 homolog [Solanum pennellii]|uniref:Homeobox protein BEL1 homolog n=1 Tax=Solanum pennellii TaxID=28526 RepID=A0ABM1HHD4_SOLPN|nr:homeobox protein BEL1 homolog [Solanum pennellii]